MSELSRLPLSTASKEQSIWRDTDQDVLRRNIVNLQKASNQVPADPLVHSAQRWLASRRKDVTRQYLLPFEIEQRIADDLAFVAAAQEGHKDISAVSLEEALEPQRLIIRLAANEWCSQKVKETLNAMFKLLSRCASKSNRDKAPINCLT